MDLGMYDYQTDLEEGFAHMYPVMLEGEMIGWVERKLAPELAESLRMMKVKGMDSVRLPKHHTYCL